MYAHFSDLHHMQPPPSGRHNLPRYSDREPICTALEKQKFQFGDLNRPILLFACGARPLALSRHDGRRYAKRRYKLAHAYIYIIYRILYTAMCTRYNYDVTIINARAHI